MRKNVSYLVIIILILAFLVAIPLYQQALHVILLKYTHVCRTYLELGAISGPTGYISWLRAAFYGAGIYTAAYLGDVLPLPVMVLCGGVASFCWL